MELWLDFEIIKNDLPEHRTDGLASLLSQFFQVLFLFGTEFDGEVFRNCLEVQLALGRRIDMINIAGSAADVDITHCYPCKKPVFMLAYPLTAQCQCPWGRAGVRLFSWSGEALPSSSWFIPRPLYDLFPIENIFAGPGGFNDRIIWDAAGGCHVAHVIWGEAKILGYFVHGHGQRYWFSHGLNPQRSRSIL